MNNFLLHRFANVLILILIPYGARCVTYSIIEIENGHNLTMECPMGNVKWTITWDDQPKLAAECSYKSQLCKSYLDNTSQPRRYDYIASYQKPNDFVSNINNNFTSYLQVTNISRSLTKVVCDSIGWEIHVIDPPVRVAILANDIPRFALVKAGSNVNFTCWSDLTAQENSTLFIYKDTPSNVLTRAANRSRLTYTMWNVQSPPDNFTVGCRRDSDEATVQVAVKTCKVTQHEFTANSHIDAIDVNPDDIVELVCRAESNCESDMTLNMGTTREILSRVTLPQSIRYLMTKFQCGASFYVGCNVEDQFTFTERNILVRVSPCVTILVNGLNAEDSLIPNEVNICSGDAVSVVCQYEGRSNSVFSMFWKSSNGDWRVLNGSSQNVISYTLPGDYSYNSYTDNWIGCSVQGVVSMFRINIMQCPVPTEPSSSKNSKVVVVIGVSLGAVFVLVIMTVTLVVYCTRSRRSAAQRAAAREGEGNGRPTGAPSLTDDAMVSDPPSYDEIFYTNVSSQIGPDPTALRSPPEYDSLPPSYTDVVHYYKHNNSGVINYTLDSSI